MEISEMEFSEDDLRLIMAMCVSANPQYPAQDMYPAWQPIYDKAEAQLRLLEDEEWLMSMPLPKPFADAEGRRQFLEDSATETPIRQRP